MFVLVFTNKWTIQEMTFLEKSPHTYRLMDDKGRYRYVRHDKVFETNEAANEAFHKLLEKKVAEARAKYKRLKLELAAASPSEKKTRD